MKSFTYTVQDELGLHARPAGLLAKLAAGCTSTLPLITEPKSRTLKTDGNHDAWALKKVILLPLLLRVQRRS